jgi:chromate transporter
VRQVTPGPVFTTATFIGYVLGGTHGALVATLGIFLRERFWMESTRLMFVVMYELGRAAIVDLTTIILPIISAIILFRFRLNSAWLVFGGAVIGLLLYRPA